nr:elongator complex protein 5-like [Coffea arabica]
MAAEAISRALRDGALEGEHAPALTIKDSIHAPLGAFVFDHILAQLSSNISSSKSQAQGIVLVAFARSPQFYAELLKSKANDAASLKKWLRIVDCYTDPLGWKIQLAESGIVSNRSTQNATTASLCKNVRDLDMLFSSIVELGKEVIRETKGRFAVAIDSVSEILRHASISSAASLLSNLRSHDQVACLFWLFHSDLHEMKASSALEYISSMVACVEPISNTTNGKGMNSENLPLIEQNLGRGKFSVRFKRRNGRIRLMSEELHTEQMGINFVPAFEDYVTSQSLVPKVQFSLQLSEKERNDRAKVVLPFEHQGDGKPIQIYDGRRSVSESKTENKETNAEKMHVNEDSGRGEIIYIRDSDDEMPDSDEDPDDDLDI